MDEYKIMIDEAVHLLNWEFIIKSYEILNLDYSYDNKFSSKNIVKKNTKKKLIIENSKPKISDLKEELINVINFVIEQDINEFAYGHWIINWFNEEESELGSELQILFTPTQSIAFENEPCLEVPTKNDSMEMMELSVLETLLIKAEGNEEYELAQAIFNTIKRIKKKL